MADQEFSQANLVDQYQKQDNYHETVEHVQEGMPENGGGDASSTAITPGTQINASKNDDDERYLSPRGLTILIFVRFLLCYPL